MQFEVERQPPGLIELDSAFATGYFNHRAKSYTIPSEFPLVSRVVGGCLYDSSGDKVRSAERIGGYGGDHVLSINPDHAEMPRGARRIPGRSLFLGNFMDQYGHFITEFLSRLWLLESQIEFDRFVVYPFIFGRKVRDYHKFFLGKLLGPDFQSRLEMIDSPAIFDHVAVPEALISINTRVNLRVRAVYEQVKIADTGSTARKLFLSRSDKLKNQRIGNVAEVEQLFESKGFRVIYPEALSMHQQMELYAGCEVLAGLSGSALHNILFAKDGCRLVEIGDTRSPTKFLKTQAMVNFISGAKSDKIAFIPGKEKDCMDLCHLESDLDRIVGQSRVKG